MKTITETERRAIEQRFEAAQQALEYPLPEYLLSDFRGAIATGEYEVEGTLKMFVGFGQREDFRKIQVFWLS